MDTQNKSDETSNIFFIDEPESPPKKTPIFKRFLNLFKKEKINRTEHFNPEMIDPIDIFLPKEEDSQPHRTDIKDFDLIFGDADDELMPSVEEPGTNNDNILSNVEITLPQIEPSDLDLRLDDCIKDLENILNNQETPKYPNFKINAPEEDMISLRGGYLADNPPPEHINEYNSDYYQSLKIHSHYQNQSNTPFDYTIDRDILRSNPYRLIQKLKETLDHIGRSINLVNGDHRYAIIDHLIDTLVILTGNTPVANCKENMQPFIANLFLENKHLRKVLQESKTNESDVINLYNQLVDDVNKDREERRLTIKSYITTKKVADIAYLQLKWCIQNDERYNVPLDAIASRSVFTKSVREQFKTLRDVALATQAEIINNHGIGNTTLENIINYFNEKRLPAICFYPDFGYYDEIYYIKTPSIKNFEFLLPKYLSKELNKFEKSQYYRLGSDAQSISSNSHTATINDYVEKYPYFFDDDGS